MKITWTPLHGEKTHPLTEHAKGKLRELENGPIPSLLINAGVINRFLREDLAEVVQLPSPYKTHKGKLTNFVRITEAGRKRLKELI